MGAVLRLTVVKSPGGVSSWFDKVLRSPSLREVSHRGHFVRYYAPASGYTLRSEPCIPRAGNIGQQYPLN